MMGGGFNSPGGVNEIKNPPPLHATISEALRLHLAGRLADAEKVCRQVLAANPHDADGLHLLGLIAHQTRHYDAALELIRRAIHLKDSDASYHASLGIVLNDQGKLEEAVASYDRALTLKPDYAEVHNNRGNTLKDLGLLGEAVASYDRALLLRPDLAAAHYNRGNALQEQGRFAEAVACFDHALALRPDAVDAYINRGNALKDHGKLAEAVTSYDRALALNPNVASAHYNRGNALKDQGKLIEAVACYERALALKPDYAEAYSNLALTAMERGEEMKALHFVRRSLKTKETPEAKRLFVACVRRLREMTGDSEIRAATIRALTEPWDRPGDLAGHAVALIKGNPDVAGYVARAAAAWPNQLSAGELFGTDGLATLAMDPLLVALLQTTTVCDFDMERFLTMARRALLEIAEEPSSHSDNSTVRFYGALACQCFINEYVFSTTEEETQKVSAAKASLNAALEGGAEIPVLWLIALASYSPLCSIPQATRLLEREWPQEVVSLLTQQVREPAAEVALRATLTRLTDVDGAVSLEVQRQYEENPYPRWIKIATGATATNILSYVSKKLPLASIEHQSASSTIDVLIAGCGTGEHPIGTSLAIPAARLLAIDLSLSSLGYALRKTREMGLTSIEYAQADLLKLDALGRRFDIVESGGVLHHLEDPWAGWRVLLSVLRPGGFMKLGLYSAIARQDIVRIRKLIAQQGYGTTTSEIKRCRQHLMALGPGAPPALMSQDFFSMSGCRDLLFHVQEHRLTLPDIESFLRENDLAFLGFELDFDVRAAYKSRFPNDPAGTNLGQWQIFERENPATFVTMYQFWIQKTAAA